MYVPHFQIEPAVAGQAHQAVLQLALEVHVRVHGTRFAGEDNDLQRDALCTQHARNRECSQPSI